MQWICPFIYLMLFGEGVMPKIVLEQQEETVTLLVGEISTLKCNMTGGHMGNHYMYWYRKNQDNTLTFIFREDDFYGSGFKENFHGEIDSANNKFTLQIIKATVREEGIYYCAARYHSASSPFLSNSETNNENTQVLFLGSPKVTNQSQMWDWTPDLLTPWSMYCQLLNAASCSVSHDLNNALWRYLTPKKVGSSIGQVRGGGRGRNTSSYPYIISLNALISYIGPLDKFLLHMVK